MGNSEICRDAFGVDGLRVLLRQIIQSLQRYSTAAGVSRILAAVVDGQVEAVGRRDLLCPALRPSLPGYRGFNCGKASGGHVLSKNAGHLLAQLRIRTRG